MSDTPRQYHEQMVHFLRKSITFADAGTTVTVGSIPAGSVILRPCSGVHVTTVFNGDSSNIISVGPSTDTGTDLWMDDEALGTLGFIPFEQAVSNNVGTSDVIVQAAVVSTASATTGAGEIVICYVPDTDL